jgi:pyridoxine 4-dehydrogenase
MPVSTHTIGGITLRPIGLGCAHFTGAGVWGPPQDPAESVRVLRRALELGVNLIDTADCYGPYVSEEIVREALHPFPDDIVLNTKIGQLHGRPGSPGDPWPRIGRPDYLRFALEMSLRRLGVEHLKLVHLHGPDSTVPIEDSVGALKELQDEGKIGEIGISNVTIEQLEIARGVANIVSVQNLFNLVQQEEAPMLARCEELGIAFLPFFPLALGRILPGGPFDELAESVEATPPQLALAWLLHRSPALVPIPGADTVAQLEEDLGADQIEITDDVLNEASRIAATL